MSTTLTHFITHTLVSPQLKIIQNNVFYSNVLPTYEKNAAYRCIWNARRAV